MSGMPSLKQLRQYVIPQAKKAQADLDSRMASVPSVCQAGCDACCYQLVSVHTWEEDLIGGYVQKGSSQKTEKIVR